MARTFGRIAFLVVLAVLLAAPWSAAEGPRAGGDTSPRILDQAWSWLSILWSKIGCGIDPSGLCQPAKENLEIGCGIDPVGRCHGSAQDGEQSQRDIGCGLDPSGGCGQ